MRDKNEILEELAAKRASYKAFLEAVEEDLAREKQKRIASRQGEIVNLVAEGFASGASIASLKRAYGTADYRTIKNMLDSMFTEIVALKEEVAYTPKQSWSIREDDDGVFVDTLTSTYEVIELEDGAYYMLDLYVGDDDMKADGIVLDYTQPTGVLMEIHKALNERKSHD